MKLRVLLVDDEEHLRRIAKLCLERVGGFHVVAVEGGEAALSILEQEPFHVMLLDAMMPGMDGLTTLSRIREREAGALLPVIFVTAKGGDAEIARFHAAGALGVIEKPFDPMLLSRRVLELLPASRP